MLSALRHSAGARWVLARTRMIFPDGTAQVRHGVPHPTAVRHLLSAQVSTQSLVAEAALLHEVGGWDETLTCWQDYELGFRLLRHAPQPAWCEHVFHRIYRTADSITGHSLSANASGIAAALCRLAEQVETPSAFPCAAGDAQQLSAQCRRALWLRAHIVAGRFCAEGAAPSAESLLRAVSARLRPLSFADRVVCGLLRRYTALGGRAAWRLALLWCALR